MSTITTARKSWRRSLATQLRRTLAALAAALITAVALPSAAFALSAPPEGEGHARIPAVGPIVNSAVAGQVSPTGGAWASTLTIAVIVMAALAVVTALWLASQRRTAQASAASV